MISIIIPVYNDETNILECLDSLQKQKIKVNFEIIVIEDGSKSELKNILTNYKNVKYFWKINGGPGSARNLGIKKSKGDFIVFIDSDCIADKNWLNILFHELKSNINYGGVGGRILNKNIGFFSNILHLIEFGEFINGKKREVRIVPACNSIYRKKLLYDVKLFDEKLFYGEDTDLNWKIINKTKKNIIYQPNAIIFHKTTGNLKSIVKRMYHMGVGAFNTRFKHKNLKNSWITNKWIVFLGFIFLPFVSALRLFLRNKKIPSTIISIPFYFVYWFGILVAPARHLKSTRKL